MIESPKKRKIVFMIVLFILLLSLSTFYSEKLGISGIGSSFKKNCIANKTVSHQVYLKLAQNNELQSAEKKDSGHLQENNNHSPQKKEQQKKAPLKKFVPSEKIEVDTVVDFPIDI